MLMPVRGTTLKHARQVHEKVSELMDKVFMFLSRVFFVYTQNLGGINMTTMLEKELELEQEACDMAREKLEQMLHEAN